MADAPERSARISGRLSGQSEGKLMRREPATHSLLSLVHHSANDTVGRCRWLRRQLEAKGTCGWGSCLLVFSESWPTAAGSQQQGHREPRSRHTDMLLRRKHASHKSVGRLEGNKFPERVQGHRK